VCFLVVIGFLGLMVFHYNNKTKAAKKKKQSADAIQNIEDIQKDQVRNIAFGPNDAETRV